MSGLSQNKNCCKMSGKENKNTRESLQVWKRLFRPQRIKQKSTCKSHSQQQICGSMETVRVLWINFIVCKVRRRGFTTSALPATCFRGFSYFVMRATGYVVFHVSKTLLPMLFFAQYMTTVQKLLCKIQFPCSNCELQIGDLQ